MSISYGSERTRDERCSDVASREGIALSVMLRKEIQYKKLIMYRGEQQEILTRAKELIDRNIRAINNGKRTSNNESSNNRQDTERVKLNIEGNSVKIAILRQEIEQLKT